jgi:predicted outer membrane protein
MGGICRNWVAAVALVLAAAGAFGSASRAAETPQTCAKEDFESVVEIAAGSLRDLNSKNRPAFQEKLRELKEKRNWSHDDFIEKAKPFVKDDKTAVYDKTTDELLSAIASMGEAGANAETPDCAILLDLRTRMKMLVDTQTAKWSYMFEKLDAELAK